MSLITPKLPIDFTIEPQLKCNLKCKMCARSAYDFGMKSYKEWDYHTLIKIIDSLLFANNIQIGGNHEPLLYKYFLEGTQYISNLGMNTPFTTNGILLTEDIIKRIPDRSMVYISIDGCSEEAYSDIRNADFKKTLANLIKLRQLKPNITIGINTVLFKDTILNSRNLIPLCYQYNIHMVLIYPIIFSKEINDEYSPFKDELKFYKDMTMLKNMLGIYGIKHTCPPLEMYERPCSVPWVSPVVAINGDVYPCCYAYINRPKPTEKKIWYMYYKDRKFKVNQDQYVMGNLFDSNYDFTKIWKGDKYSELRMKLSQINYNVRKKYENIENYPMMEDRLENTFNEYNPDEPFDFCKICLFRWGRMGNI